MRSPFPTGGSAGSYPLRVIPHFPESPHNQFLSGVPEPIPWRHEMQEFKSRLVVLAVVAAAAVAAVLGNYGWIVKLPK